MTQLVENGPAATAVSFLRSLENGDLAAVKALIAPEFTMQFPGGVEFADFDALFAWARGRYTGVRKKFERIDVAESRAIRPSSMSAARCPGAGWMAMNFRASAISTVSI